MGSISVIFIILFFVYQWYTIHCAQVGMIPKPDNTEESESSRNEFLDDYKKAKKKHTFDNMKEVAGSESEPPRRSYLRKMKVETDRHDLEKWMKVIKEDETEIIVALNELEFLVHQIDNANNFMSEGGIEILFKMMDHENPAITSAALSVLIAAMQGNPSIQSYVEEFNLFGHFKKAIESKSENLSRFISVVSCYIRNVPTHQLEFIHGQGLEMLALILKDYSLPLTYKYKVIDLLGDLATEIFYNSSKNGELDREILQSYFAWNANVSRICEEIPSYLQFEGFSFQEKVVVAMNALHDICKHSFQKDYVIKMISDVKKFYSEQKWYSSIDNELKFSIVNDLNELMRKIVNKGKKDEL